MALLWITWAAVALHQARKRGWLHGPRIVWWNVDLFGDQVLLLCGLVVSSLAARGVAVAMGVKDGASPAPAVAFWSIVASSSITLLAWRMLRRSDGSGASQRMPAARAIAAGLAGLVVAWPLVSLVAMAGSWVQQRMGGPPAPDTGHQTLDQLRQHAGEVSAWALGAAVVVLSPVVEEIVWRGAVQQALKALGIRRMVAVTASAVMFALVHWSAVPPDARLSALPALALLGVALGWMMERCGRLAAPVAAHAAFNLANLLLFSMLPG